MLQTNHSKGVLRYSPKSAGHKSSKWWVVLDCDPEIGTYYRHLFHIYFHKCQRLMRPAWKEHVTIVRDEEPSNKALWEAHSGDVLDFTYGAEIGTDGLYCWLSVECPKAVEIRRELGLPEQPQIPFHLTIGNLK